MSSIIYEVILKRHPGGNKPSVIHFYDEDRDVAIKAMKLYDKKNGFTLVEDGHRFSIADIVLRARSVPDYDVVSETSFHEIDELMR